MFWIHFPHLHMTRNNIFLTVVDDCSRYTWIQMLTHKSEAPIKIKLFFAFIKTRFNKEIRSLRSNNAKELDLVDFLKEYGTIHQLSRPYRPEQNCVVERKHRHLLNVERALIFQSKVPILFLWGIA